MSKIAIFRPPPKTSKSTLIISVTGRQSATLSGCSKPGPTQDLVPVADFARGGGGLAGIAPKKRVFF